MTRIKLNFDLVDGGTKILVTNISDEFIGYLSEYDKGYRFIGQDWVHNIDVKEGESFKHSLYIEGSLEHAKEKINVIVEQYINRFFEKEEV